MYYKRLDVRRAITDFVNAGEGGSLRECAFYNRRARSLQRYFGENGSKRPVILDSPAAFDRALALGASAFYCSYWRNQKQDFSDPIRRDLVWTIRAKRGGLKFAKLITAWVLEALEEAGVSEPWVKYSGDLGFDIVIPLEAIPFEAWDDDPEVLSGFQEGLTSYIAGYLRERFSDVAVEGVTSSIEIKRGTETCLLSELRVRRGLLLAPMSLNPETGLVSVPVDPKLVGEFSVLDASPGRVRAFEWARLPKVTVGLVKRARSLQVAPAETGHGTGRTLCASWGWYDETMET